MPETGRAHKIFVVGAGPGTPDMLTPAAREIIRRCRWFVGGRRLLQLALALRADVGDAAAPETIRTHVLDADLDAARDFIADGLEEADVCVVTSGDPGCFSILPFLKDNFPGRNEVVPGISSVQLLAARLALPWQDWRLVSRHGREDAGPEPAPTTATVYFCDPRHTPQELARRILAAGPDCAAAVGSFLGQSEELVITAGLSEIASGEFPGHSLLLVLPGTTAGASAAESEDGPVAHMAPAPTAISTAVTMSPTTAPGIPDELWLRAEGVPLSKSEMRAVLMAKAQPAGRGVIWDVGAGTGSYGIEAALLVPGATVIAVDKNPAACHVIAANAERFGVRVQVVCVEAPEGFETLAPPDLVIIGGNEGRLAPIFKTAVRALNPGGRIVVTALLEETKQTAHRVFAESGLVNRSATRVAISRGEAHEWVEHNPVIIFTGDREE
ncbi:MAG: precorrin-6y C5,15-methyltransferase (decarboxylating) subunit CbiE [Thermoleophilia bacterium]